MSEFNEPWEIKRSPFKGSESALAYGADGKPVLGWQDMGFVPSEEYPNVDKFFLRAVKCVNSHVALIEACQSALSLANDRQYNSGDYDIIEKCRVALDLAGESHE